MNLCAALTYNAHQLDRRDGSRWDLAEHARGSTVTGMQQGRGGMGSHKHGVSGRAPRSPRYKLMQKTLEDNRRSTEETKRRLKPKMAASFEELFGKR
jgi:hypothetical protein